MASRSGRFILLAHPVRHGLEFEAGNQVCLEFAPADHARTSSRALCARSCRVLNNFR